MIFVTVGTHEQPFDRLIRKIDQLKADDIIADDVFIQTGYSTFVPQHCEWRKMLSYDEMQEKIEMARIVITHGGPASFIAPLKEGKIPIVVPRLKCHEEHVNNHQVEFVQMVYERQKNIIPVFDVEELREVIDNYEEVVQGRGAYMMSNNKNFNEQLEKITDDLFGL